MTTTMPPHPTDPIQFARLDDGIVVVRVQGRGTHQCSADLRHVFELTRDGDPPPHYVLDLTHCITMDSTFMGTLAGMAIHQRQRDGSSLIVANANAHVRELLETLGLHYILDLRPSAAAGVPDAAAPAVAEAMQVPDRPQRSRIEQIVHMLEAHERLVDVDTRNEIRFEGVLKSLRESLEREKKRLC